MKAFIENEIKFTKIKFDASTPGSKLYEEYKHWINAYEALIEQLPEDQVLISSGLARVIKARASQYICSLCGEWDLGTDCLCSSCAGN